MKKTIALMAGVALALPLVMHAATLQSGSSYSLGRDEVVNDDLYIGSGNITVAGSVFGDLYGAGGNISFSGTVSEDLNVAGGSLSLIGNVGDDLHAAGGNITVSGTIGGDLVAGGGEVQLVSGAIVGGDLVVGGGKVLIDGRVNGNVRIGSGEVIIGEHAVIAGDLTYTSNKEATISSAAQIFGKTEFKKSHTPRERGVGMAIGFLGLGILLKTLMGLVAVLLFALVFKKRATQILHHAIKNPWQNVLWGLVILVVVPVAAILLFFTVLGAMVGGIVLLAYIAWLIFAGINASIILGSWLYQKITKGETMTINWKSATLGVVALALLKLVPFIGWIVCLLVFLLSLGAIGKTWHESVWKDR